MKKLLLITTLFIVVSANAQENFKWEKIDSVEKIKDKIYSDTKMFIAQTWKSAQNVIQNDDKEAGVILIKGSHTKKVKQYIEDYVYVYNYSITFQMKDNKFRLILDNVSCESATFRNGAYQIYKIQPFDVDNGTVPNTWGETGSLPTKKAIEMISSLRQDLQSIVDSYVSYIKKPSGVSSDW